MSPRTKYPSRLSISNERSNYYAMGYVGTQEDYLEHMIHWGINYSEDFRVSNTQEIINNHTINKTNDVISTLQDDILDIKGHIKDLENAVNVNRTFREVILRRMEDHVPDTTETVESTHQDVVNKNHLERIEKLEKALGFISTHSWNKSFQDGIKEALK